MTILVSIFEFYKRVVVLMKQRQAFFFFVCMVCFLIRTLPAQNFQMKHYTIENGLPSNLIKFTEQDDDGFIWIATDGGLSRFDGKTFLQFNQHLPSLYVKGLHYKSGVGLYVLSDNGLTLLSKSEFSYQSTLIISGASFPTDTTVYFPKSLYFDELQNIWIGEPNAIVKFDGKRLTRFSLDQKYHTDSFSRSYIFFQNKSKDLYAATWNGYLLKFDPSSRQFIEIKTTYPVPLERIYSLLSVSDSIYYLGTRHGLFELSPPTSLKPNYSLRKLNSVMGINGISDVFSGHVLMGTLSDGLYGWNSLLPNSSAKKLDLKTPVVINHLFSAKDGSIWGSTDGGLVVLKTSVFSPLPFHSSNLFIRSISAIDSHSVIYSVPEGVFKLNLLKNHTYQHSTIISYDRYFVFTSASTSEKTWISNRDGSLSVFEKNKFYTIQEPNSTLRLNLLEPDQLGGLWSYQDATGNIVYIHSDNHQSVLTKKDGVSSTIHSIYVSESGDVYFGGSTKESYLYQFNSQTNSLENISLPVPDELNLIVYAIHKKDGQLWLGTNHGLFLQTSDYLNKFDVTDNFGIPIIKSIISDSNDNLWLGTEKGLYIFTDKSFLFFDTDDGLPNATLTPHGLVKLANGKMVIGTASGIAYSQLNVNQLRTTPTPVFSDIAFSETTTLNNQWVPLSGTLMNLSFFSPVFPSEKIKYQLRISEIINQWTEFSPQNQFLISNISTGKYQLELRAIQNGYLISPISKYSVTIYSPWYTSWWMLLIYILFGILLFSVLFVSLQKYRFRQFKKRQEELEKIVEERTRNLFEEKEKTEAALVLVKAHEQSLNESLEELKKAYDHVKIANELKSELLNVATHDLKNPLQAIMGYTEIVRTILGEKTSVSSHLEKIHQSSDRMLKLVNNLLDTSAIESGKLELILKPVNFEKLVSTVISHNLPQSEIKQQKITFQVTSTDSFMIIADEHRIQEAVDNLISNAIKYSPFGKDIVVSISTSGNQAILSIRDDGPGLTKTDLANLFKKFQRLSAKPTGGETSTGLGLSIVKDIMDLHKGNVWAESELGKGTTFYLSLRLLFDA